MVNSKPKARHKRKAKKPKLNPAERQKLAIQSAQKREIRSIFRNSGFLRVLKISDKEITFKGTTSDLDDVYVYENVIVVLEYTTATSQNHGVRDHLYNKKAIFDKIINNKTDFIAFLEEKFPTFKSARSAYYTNAQMRVVVVYCSRDHVRQKYKDSVDSVVYLDFSIVKYFKVVANAIKHSLRPELFNFMGLTIRDIGRNVTRPSTTVDTFKGSILPESHSNFGKGFKVVSFYMNADSLLKRSYVLRRDGWNDEGGLYQRMISTGKISAIRKYLKTNKKVFVNNIIVTLPDSTKTLDDNGDTIDVSTIEETSPVNITIPNEFNCVGIIDGQHRVFAYHEGGSFEEEISILREQQNLLVTGILYPRNVDRLTKTTFEARLFSEINYNQKKAPPDLIQAINLLLTPYSPTSIAKQIINILNDGNGALADAFERYFYEKDKLKTTSIVSYGLVPLVKLEGDDSLFKIWNNSDKDDLAKGNNEALLMAYIGFCATEIDHFLAAVKAVMPNSKWTSEKSIKGRLLTTTMVNGFIMCLRRLVEEGKTASVSSYMTSLKELDKFDFSVYHSSQYGQMGRDIYDKFFD